ncbi:MAG TPA: D-hexose-6-phosphate mutarotase [Bacteroidales bacterium]
MIINELNQKYAIPGHVEFKDGKGGLPTAFIKNKLAEAEVSLYGAHVLKYQPEGQKDVLCISANSIFEDGKPIRGGIPVCFPWFGPHATDSTKPQHGFARLLTWSVLSTTALANGSTQLMLELESNSHTKSIWPFSFRAEMKIVVGRSLEVTLTYTNTGTEAFVCSDALHTYFNISDVTNTKIHGLKGTVYYKGFEKEPTGKQSEDLLMIKQEENRRYINHSAECIIEDNGFNRKIHVAKKGSNVTVVWNPWENAKNIPDMPDDGYKSMVCIEAVNTYDDVVKVIPGKSFSVSTEIRVE